MTVIGADAALFPAASKAATVKVLAEPQVSETLADNPLVLATEAPPESTL